MQSLTTNHLSIVALREDLPLLKTKSPSLSGERGIHGSEVDNKPYGKSVRLVNG